METNRVWLFDRISLISVIIPYYSKTDQAFLLLSSLCSKSRNKLIEFYDEFKKIMKNYWSYLHLDIYNIKLIYLPSDLFIFDIMLTNVTSTEIFIDFVNCLKQKQGYYFENHFMHEQLMFNNIQIYSNLTESLSSLRDTLRTLKTFNYEIRSNKAESSRNESLFDKISIIILNEVIIKFFNHMS